MDASVKQKKTFSSWHRRRLQSPAERIVDGIVHGAAILITLAFGSTLLTLALVKTAPEQFPALLTYVVSMLVLFSVSMAFNLWPRTEIKHVLARLDQAAIFLFIAGTYTPFLSLVWETQIGQGLTIFVWSAALIGVALKLVVPQHFGRLAILLYLAIGWSGIFVFQKLSVQLPAAALWLLLAGGLSYSAGIIFHLWDKIKFNNAIWHLFVLVGASLHLIAIFDAMVFSRWV